MEARPMDSPDALAAFELRRPPQPGPLIFASPHSGRIYPESLMAASGLDARAIRRSEDAHVDVLIEGALDHGASLMLARYARAFVDLNREPYELDQAMFEDELPAYARNSSPRVAAGLGTIARVVANGQEIYTRKLTFAEARARIEQVHGPWHEALEALTDQTRTAHGRALVVDWHSMPSKAARTAHGQSCDFVLGDRYGAACEATISGAVEDTLAHLGYRVARNNPYAGGYTTERYGRPQMGISALQIEINRALYLDETTLDRSSGFERLRSDLTTVFAALAEAV